MVRVIMIKLTGETYMTTNIISPIVVTSNGSGYNTPNVTLALGTLRMNSTTGRMETWNGLAWITISVDFDSDTIKNYIKNVMNDVSKHVTTRAPDNVTINDALGEWIEACERFKVIVTLAEHSK